MSAFPPDFTYFLYSTSSPLPDLQGLHSPMAHVEFKRCVSSAPSVSGLMGRPEGCGLVTGAQNGNPLQFLTWDLYGFDLDVIADAELINGDELLAPLQPGPWSDGQGHFPGTSRPVQGDRAFAGAWL